MKTTGVDWMATLIVLVGALVLFAIGWAIPSAPSIPQEEGAERPVAATTALDIELARCKTLGPDAAADAACLKAWGVVSKRFVEYGELHRRVVVNQTPTRRSREEGDTGGCGERGQPLQSRSVPDSDSGRSSARLEEQPR
jgi:conjugative transfer region protein TrbK